MRFGLNEVTEGAEDAAVAAVDEVMEGALLGVYSKPFLGFLRKVLPSSLSSSTSLKSLTHSPSARPVELTRSRASIDAA